MTRDQHTDAAVDRMRAELRIRDQIIGLEATARAARARADREAERRKKLKARLEQERETVRAQRIRIRELETRGFAGLARRVKRRLSG
ncbi:MAG: hypothetical protein ACJ71Z_11040 [Aeromicrobium sp.]